MKWLWREERNMRPVVEDWWPFFIHACCKTAQGRGTGNGGRNNDVHSLIDAGAVLI